MLLFLKIKTLFLRNERRMSIGKVTSCNDVIHVLADKYFQPYPVHSLCSQHDGFLVGPVEFLQLLSFSMESLSSDFFHGWFLLRRALGLGPWAQSSSQFFLWVISFSPRTSLYVQFNTFVSSPILAPELQTQISNCLFDIST